MRTLTIRFCHTIFVGAMLGMSGSLVSGAEVPSDLRTALKPFATLSVDVEGNAVRLVLNQADVAPETYRALQIAYCHSALPPSRRPWNGLQLQRLEVLNISRMQGFAFAGGKPECTHWSKLPFEQKSKFVEERTRLCLGGQTCGPVSPPK